MVIINKEKKSYLLFRKVIMSVVSMFSFLTFIYNILGSETLVLTTYYPAPYGGYTRLLTTDMTVLARNSGNVGIGTNNPQFKLDVQNGSIATSGRIGTQGYSPDSGYPSGWNGGIHTWDIYAHSSIRADSQFCIGSDCITAWPRCDTQIYDITGDVSCSDVNARIIGFRSYSCSQNFEIPLRIEYGSEGELVTSQIFKLDYGSFGACGALICCTGL